MKTIEINLYSFDELSDKAKELFSSLTKSERKSFVKAICFEWQTGLKTDEKEMFIDLI